MPHSPEPVPTVSPTGGSDAAPARPGWVVSSFTSAHAAQWRARVARAGYFPTASVRGRA